MQAFNKYTSLLPLLFILTTIFLGCEQSGVESQRVDFDSVKSFINCHIDDIYKDPVRTLPLLDSLQDNAADSSTIQLITLYRSFCQYNINNSLDNAVATINRVNEYCQRHPKDLRLRAAYWNHLSIFAPTADSTIKCLEKSYSCLEAYDDIRGLITVNINLADNHRLMGNMPEAALYWRRALSLADSLNVKDMMPDISIGLAQVYSDMARYDLADHFFAVADSLGVGERLHYLLYMAQGNSHYNRNEYDKSLDYFYKALSTLGNLHSNFHLLPIYIDLAELYTLKGYYDSAHVYLDKAWTAIDGNVVPNADFYLYSLSADLAYRERRDKDAEIYLDSLEKIENVSLTYLYQHKRRLMEHFARDGNYAQAYAFRNEVDNFDDSIRNMQKQANIAEVDSRYRRDTTLLHQQLVISQTRQEADRSRITVLVVLLAFVLLLVATERLWVKRQRDAQEARRQAQIRIAKLRMQGVRNRVTPHLFFNALQAARLKGPDPVYERLIDVLRDNIIIGDSTSVTLEDELRIVEHYVALYTSTHNIKPVVNIARLGEMEKKLLIPSMSIQLPVENALKHAFTSETRNPYVNVSLTLSGNVLHVAITDNGQGYNPARHNNGENSTGAGMNILYQTFELLNQFNREKICFNIVSPVLEGNGTRVELTVPQDYDYSFYNS